MNLKLSAFIYITTKITESTKINIQNLIRLQIKIVQNNDRYNVIVNMEFINEILKKAHVENILLARSATTYECILFSYKQYVRKIFFH